MAWAGLDEEALRVFSRFCDMVGFVIKPGKSSIGNSIVSLCLIGKFPSHGNGNHLFIPHTEEKRTKWPRLIESCLKLGRIPHQCLEKLIGRLSFDMARIFGKFARAQLRPMRQKFYRRVYNAQLPQHERCTLECRRSIIADLAPRIAVSRSPITGRTIYTDAAKTPPVICGLLPNGMSKHPQPETQRSAHVPATWPYLFRRTALIYGLGPLSSVAYFEDHAPSMRGKSF